MDLETSTALIFLEIYDGLWELTTHHFDELIWIFGDESMGKFFLERPAVTFTHIYVFISKIVIHKLDLWGGLELKYKLLSIFEGFFGY